MSIIDLRAEVQKYCNIRVKYVNDSEYLSDKCPAYIDVETIFILDTLSYEKKIMAEAHELGHMYVKEKGLLCLQHTTYDEPTEFLILEFNNALSHRHLVRLLEQDFSISSEFHLELRSDISEIKEYIETVEYIEVLHGLGLRLYDIESTVSSMEHEILPLLQINNKVHDAYKSSIEILNLISPNMPKKEQMTLIDDFFNLLGYSFSKKYL